MVSINKSRKGLSMPGSVAGLVVMMVVVVVLLFIFKGPASAASSQFNSELLKIKSDKCKLDSDRAKSQGTDISKNDKDKDGFNDACDVCVNPAKTGQEAIQDSDQDGMPDACDEDFNIPKKSGCLGSGWNEEARKDGKCVK